MSYRRKRILECLLFPSLPKHSLPVLGLHLLCKVSVASLRMSDGNSEEHLNRQTFAYVKLEVVCSEEVAFVLTLG